MSRKTITLTAIAAVAIATTLFPGGEYAVALAQVADAELIMTDPVNAAERAPETSITYVSEPVVQPLPAADDVSQPAASLTQLVGAIDTARPLSAEMHCLAGAVYFEARGEELAGQLAVAQVIINRTEDGRFPKSYCGVVSQPGQFSFMRGRQMPTIRTGSPAWTRAVAIAEIAHKRLWRSEADEAVFFHANYVRPGWSQRKIRLAQIDTHIFYR